MKLTRSAGYAVVAVGHIARNNQPGPVLAKSIAKQHKIPLDYLFKILHQLVQANILRSIRGPRGGFFLGRPLSKISLLNVIEAVDGSFLIEPSLSSSRTEGTYNKRVINAYQLAARLAANSLGKTTMATLVGPKKTTRKKGR